MTNILRIVCLLAFLLLAANNSALAADQPAAQTEQELIRISPSGEDVAKASQIVFHFKNPAIDLGRMERNEAAVPFLIEPQVACDWRWLTTTTLACNLSQQNGLKNATRYQIKANHRVTGREGQSLLPAITRYLTLESATLITERPAVINSYLTKWSGAEKPAFCIFFNQAVTGESVTQHLFFQAKSGRTAITLLPRTERSTPDQWCGEPATPLPADERIELRIEPGIVAVGGEERGIEERSIDSASTYPPFAFLGIECCAPLLKDGASPTVGTVRDPSGLCRSGAMFRLPVQQTPVTGETIRGRCEPLQQINLLFSSPLQSDHGLALSPAHSPPGSPWLALDEQSSVARLSPASGLKAAERYTLTGDATEVRDIFGRSLRAPIDFQFETDNRSPRLAFNGGFAVLEKEEDTHLPIAVQNLDSLTVTYTTKTVAGTSPRQTITIPVDNVPNLSYYVPLKARNLLPLPATVLPPAPLLTHVKHSGIVEGTITSTPRQPRNSNPFEHNNDSFSLSITPFQIHAKLGHFNSLVWVTTLADGKPAKNVKASLVVGGRKSLTGPTTLLASATTDANGIARLPGLSTLDPSLNLDEKDRELQVFVERGTDLGVLPLNYNTRTEEAPRDYSFWSEQKAAFGHLRAWGTTPQGVYKLGQPVQFKLFVRHQDERTLTPAPSEGYSLEVVDPRGTTVHRVPELTLSPFGTYSGEFTVPESGAAGIYSFVLRASFASSPSNWNKPQWTPLQIVIADFNPAPFRANTELNTAQFLAGQTATITTEATLHAGGPYTANPARITATLATRELTATSAPGFSFSSYLPAATNNTPYESSDPVREIIHQSEGALSPSGTRETTFTVPDSQIAYGTITVESGIRDDRGRTIANSKSAPYLGRNRYVGLQFEDWLYSAKAPLTVKALVIDEAQQLTAGAPVTVTFERLETSAARMRSAGNAYVSEYSHRWTEEAKCELISAPTPVECTFTPKVGGSYRARAVVKDTMQRVHTTTEYTWVTSSVAEGEVVWGSEEDNSLELVPEKRTYAVGDRARFLVKNPFPGATALLTTERYGIIKTWRERLKGSTPVIEVPITPELIPGFYLSVVVASPRVQKPPTESGVDLGKPAIKVGYAQIDVLDPYKALTVSARPERKEYKPGEKVRVTLEATTQQGAHPPAELAVVVLDEAVFDLIKSGRDYFDPYKGLYSLDSLDVTNYNSVTQLLGRRKYEKKGANSGGDGGRALAERSLFKFVAYWNPSLILNAPSSESNNRQAQIEFAAPDNLTGWRILAFATTKTDRMGLGESQFSVTQPTEIRSALPNFLTEGDSATAVFTVLNRSTATRTLRVHLSAEGAIDKPLTKTESIEVAPFQRVELSLPVKATKPGTITFAVHAGDNVDSDALRTTLAVKPLRTLESTTASQYIEGESGRTELTLPANIHTDVGGITVQLAPTVLTSLDRDFTRIKEYPYSCWEQRLTKAVMAALYGNVKPRLSPTLEWGEASALVLDTLSRAAAFQAPNGGMAYFIPQDEYVNPFISAYTAQAFQWLRSLGHTPPAAVEEKLHGYLGELLRRGTVSPYYSATALADVRALILAALTAGGGVTETDLLRLQDAVPTLSLFGKASYLRALASVQPSKQTRRVVTTVFDSLLAAGDESGSTLRFRETVAQPYTLNSQLREGCAILSAVVALERSHYHHPSLALSELARKLVRSIEVQRLARTTTQEMVFCTSALREYSAQYESSPPHGTWNVNLGEERLGSGTFAGFLSPPIELNRAFSATDPGTKKVITVSREGTGSIAGTGSISLNTTISSASTIPKTERTNAGIEIVREYSVQRNGKWELLKPPYTVQQGEVVRVELFVLTPAQRSFVVAEDKLPGGLEPLNTDLATTSTLDTASEAPFQRPSGSYAERFPSWTEGITPYSGFYHREVLNDAVRFYSEELRQNRYALSYTAQAVAPGEFLVPPAHAEEMYAPDVFGREIQQRFIVRPKQARE